MYVLQKERIEDPPTSCMYLLVYVSMYVCVYVSLCICIVGLYVSVCECVYVYV